MQRKVFTSKVYERKVVLVTGGCAGIGRALVLRFAQAGARLVILDLQQDELDGLLQHLADHHHVEAMGLCCDVADAAAVQAAVALVTERFGGIDVLVNNAGVSHRSTFIDTDLEVFQRVMAVNYFGALNCTKAALPSLIARRGQIIVLSSLSGFAPLLYRSAYNASKHALHGLFETLRYEIKGSGVNVMLVCPAPGHGPGGLGPRCGRGDLPRGAQAQAPAGVVQRQLAGTPAGALFPLAVRARAVAAHLRDQAGALGACLSRGQLSLRPGGIWRMPPSGAAPANRRIQPIAPSVRVPALAQPLGRPSQASSSPHRPSPRVSRC